MTAASGTARTGRHPTWDGPEQLNTPARPGLPFPAARSSGSRPVTSRTPPAPPRRPGSARSLTCPAARHGHGSYQGNRRRQSRTPADSQTLGKPPLTRLRSFRDDRTRLPSGPAAIGFGGVAWEGPGAVTAPGRPRRWDQDQPLTATVTATAAANRCQQRPATAHNTRTICATWGYVRPEKRTVAQRRTGMNPQRPCHIRATHGSDRRCLAVAHGANVSHLTWECAGQCVADHTLLSSRPQVRILLGARTVQFNDHSRNYCQCNDILLTGNHSYLMRPYRMRRPMPSPGRTVVHRPRPHWRSVTGSQTRSHAVGVQPFGGQRNRPLSTCRGALCSMAFAIGRGRRQ